MADIQNNQPVAYFYELTGVGKELVLDCNGEYARRLLEAGYTETPLYTRAAPPAMDREAIAKAIGDADAAFGYSCNLTRLVDGVATYTLTMAGYEPAEFDSIDDAHIVIAERRNAARADAIASTLSADAIRQGEGATTANSSVVPEGWKLVPIEPTPEMRQAAIDELSGPTDFSPKASAWDAIRAYRAMLAATPASHASDGGAVDEDVAFLREAARYFANRPTDGEDRAHWSNVANSERCERIANRLSAWGKMA